MNRLWVGARMPAPFTVEEPEPHRPDVILWLDVGRDFLLIADVVAADAPASELTTLLARAMAEHPDHHPERIRIADRAAADLVRKALLGTVPVEVGPTPEIIAVLGEMRKSMPASDEPASYLEEGSISVEAMGALFRAAADFYRTEPWRFLGDDRVVEFEAAALGIEGACLSVLGQAGQSYGVLVFDSFEDFDEFGSHAQAVESNPRTMDLGTALLSLAFERGSEISNGMRKEIERHRWPVAGADAYPLLLAIEPDGVSRRLTTRDVRVACAAATGLAALVRRYGRAMAGDDPPGVVARGTVKTPEPVDVVARFPHSTQVEDFGTGEETDPERELAKAREQIGRFLDDPATRAESAGWREDAQFICECLHEMKVNDGDGRFDSLRPRHVEWFLREHFARKVSADAGTIARTPEILDRYLEWLGKESIEDAITVKRARGRIAGAREEFLESAADPRAFGPAKTLAMRMHAEGVDLEDEAAVRAFIERYNRSPASGGHPPGSRPRGRGKKGKGRR